MRVLDTDPHIQGLLDQGFLIRLLHSGFGPRAYDVDVEMVCKTYVSIIL